MTGKNIIRDIRLDLLRCFAIVLVLGRHTYQYLYTYINLPSSQLSGIGYFFVSWQRIGWVGVDLFFVISGYLISNLIFKDVLKGDFSLKRFFIRRELKIYPPFFLLIIVSVAFLYVRHHPFTLGQVMADLFFVQNYFQGLWVHTWSLAVEEHFYLLLPFLIFFLDKKKIIKLLPALMLGLMVIVIIVRVINIHLQNGNNDERVYYLLTHLRIDSFMPGIMIAYFQNFKQDVFNRFLNYKYNKALFSVVFCGSMLFLWFEGHLDYAMLVYGFTILSIGFACLLLLILSVNKKHFENNRLFDLMALIGRSSYQIYLWHMCINFWVMSALLQVVHRDIPYYIKLPFYMILSILTGILMDALIEQPVLNFRNKYFPASNRVIRKTPTI